MRTAVLRFPALLALLLVTGLAACSPAPTDAPTFPGLSADQRVVDETASSLTPAQTEDLERRLAGLVGVGADPVVLVRARDADPDETLDQVEALHQAWVGATGADPGTAVAVLVNRNPEDEGDARAGVHVGQTYQEGNVPSGEQEAIVEDALIPPLRGGDVHASLVAGIDRLTSDVRDGPPTNAFEDWAAGAAATWVPWTLLALAGLGAVVAARAFGRRSRPDGPDLDRPAPSTVRPGDLHPAVGAALATGSPQASAVPATVLGLAARGALDVEQEGGETPDDHEARLRLLDRSMVRGGVDAAVWDQLSAAADDGVVAGEALGEVAADTAPTREAVRTELAHRGWWDDAAPRAHVVLGAVGVAAFVLVVVGAVIAAAGAEPLVLAGLVPLAALGVLAFVLLARHPQLSGAGLAAARPWRAYREGLEAAAKDDGVRVDLDAVLPDVVAMNLGAAWTDRLEAATEDGGVLRALSSSGGSSSGGAPGSPGVVPWVVFSGAFASSGGAGTVTTVSPGGGGGAAGST